MFLEKSKTTNRILRLTRQLWHSKFALDKTVVAYTSAVAAHRRSCLVNYQDTSVLRGAQRQQRCVRLKSCSVYLSMSTHDYWLIFPPCGLGHFRGCGVTFFSTNSRSSEAGGLRAPGACTTVVERISSRGVNPPTHGTLSAQVPTRNPLD